MGPGQLSARHYPYAPSAQSLDIDCDKSCRSTSGLLQPSPQMESYKFLPNQEYEREAKAAIMSWKSSAHAGHNGQAWPFQTKNCSGQPNSYDCGIAVIINAMHRILGLGVPITTDLNLWRRVFHAVLTSTDCAPPQKPSRCLLLHH